MPKRRFAIAMRTSCVIIPEDFQKKFRSSSPAPIKIVSDGSRQTARPKVSRVRGLLQRYNGEIGTLRLVSRGISPAISSPLQLEEVEVSSAQQRAATILSFIPMFIVLAAFAGGMQIAMDSTAGERERGSLEPLLVNPAPRRAIAGGKWLAATFTSMLSVLLTTAMVLAMLRFIPMQEFGIRFRIQSAQVALLLAAALPMCLLASAIQIYLATFAKSFKEAQSYMGLLIIMPMLPGVCSPRSTRCRGSRGCIPFLWWRSRSWREMSSRHETPPGGGLSSLRCQRSCCRCCSCS